MNMQVVFLMSEEGLHGTQYVFSSCLRFSADLICGHFKIWAG